MSLWHLLRYGSLDHEVMRGRDAYGRATEVCTVCPYTRIVFGDEVIIGPAHTFKADVGAVTTKATTEKVTKLETRKRA